MANLRIGRRSGLVLRGGRNVRSTVWGSSSFTTVSIGSPGTAVLAFALSAGGLAMRPFTIVRERFFWYTRSDVVTGGEVWGGAIGFCVVSDQSVAIGVTAVPTPITDIDSDLFYLYAANFGRFGGTQVEEVGARKDLDSKAMRKVEEGQDAIIVLETAAVTEGASMVSVIGGRTLLKLH